MPDKFIFNNQEYQYRKDDDQCILGERTVEIPIFSQYLWENKDKRVLEIGNVLRKYTPELGWNVIDKYEAGSQVYNDDISNLGAQTEFIQDIDFIFSISTFEHIGFDMGEKREFGKIIKAFETVYSRLADKGTFAFSVPVGYNQEMDWILSGFQYFSKYIGFKETKLYFMERVSDDNRWIERDRLDITAEYGAPFPYGNFLAIGEMTK